MLESDVLKNKLNAYRDCYNKMVSTSNELLNAINILKKLIGVQGSCYSVNDVSGGSNYLSHLLDQEVLLYNNIINNLIPDINSKIDNLNYRVSDALQREMLERQ